MSKGPIETFVEALPAAIAQAQGANWSAVLDEKPKPFVAGTQLLTMLVVAEPSKAEAAIQISLESALLIAGVAAGAGVQLKPENAQVVRNLFAKACEKAATGVTGLQVTVNFAKAIAWTAAKQFSISGADGGAGKIQLLVLFSADWPKLSSGKGVNVSMLENVELDVTLRFGQRQLSLREIGDLRSGSVVELDRYVQDPAELLLGDRVVARGEVVIVDGNYGLRVTEVV